MNVRELREELSDLPDDMEVILQKDPEGNGYSPLRCVDAGCVYVPEDGGEVFNDTDSADDCFLDPDEWEAMKRGPRVLVLAPAG